MNENIISAIIIDGNTYNVLPDGVKCTNCAVKDYCLRGKLGSAVTFDCASVHLEKVNIGYNQVDINILKKSMPVIMPNFGMNTVISGKKCNV